MRKLISIIYLTRRCFYNCTYCRFKASPCGPELSWEKWRDTLSILREHGVYFNLFLGNEPLTLGEDLLQLIKFLNKENFAYGLYSSFPTSLSNLLTRVIDEVKVQNLSAGYDYPYRVVNSLNLDTAKKTKAAYEVFCKARHSVKDLHATTTVTSANINFISEILRELTELGVFNALNPVHYDKDGGFDFFPKKSELGIDSRPIEEVPILDLRQNLKNYSNLVRVGYLGYNCPEYIEGMEEYRNLNWHCRMPLMVTVDVDGMMRCCGYRKGTECSKLSIFDLELDLGKYWEAWSKDIKKCPGCYWGCAYTAEYWASKPTEEERNYGKEVFTKHASWSARYGTLGHRRRDSPGMGGENILIS